ncbi:LOW QUALITY PROTEIN: uncharacterized protein LOC120269045 [Dioscorea cayenensis subsp. rotundata]|uniref:LOW QUALITY PROTEIN: uncharacterized protein LOC120269045 n=1 Tax=Dioscorea cayennensis subsp. rotundata TaxID=55577 RepID=A0AB40C044_DIOCR|nr:LOW QUALITY PROTEIN: uncharacterized protein LOC120269045 [Dioscorea cayenensis subsp. rotundata]
MAFKPTYLNMNANLELLSISDLLIDNAWNMNLLHDMFGDFLNFDYLTPDKSSHCDGNWWVWYPKSKNHRLTFMVYTHFNGAVNNIDPWVGWRFLWRLKIASRPKHFFWLLLHNGIKTYDYLLIESGPQSLCDFCDLDFELAEHLFDSCPKAQTTWFLISNFIGKQIHFHDGFSNGNWLCPSNPDLNIFDQSIIVATAWLLWKARCNLIFQFEVPDFNSIAIRAINHVREYSHSYPSQSAIFTTPSDWLSAASSLALLDCLPPHSNAAAGVSSSDLLFASSLGTLDLSLPSVSLTRKLYSESNAQRPAREGLDLASSSDGSATCSGFEDGRNSDDRKGKDGNMCRYRCQLEQEVQKLQMQLQQEFDLHVVLADAVGKETLPMVNSPSNLPNKAQELLANIAALEFTVSNLIILPVVSPKPQVWPSWLYMEEHLSSLQHSKFNESQMLQSTESDICAACRHPQEITTNSDCNLPVPCGVETGRNMMDVPPQQTGLTELKQSFLTNLWQNPNRLSEEMVRCMRNVFLCLSKSSSPIPFMATSAPECIPSPYSPIANLPTSLVSSSDSSEMASSVCSPGFKMNEIRETWTPQKTFDPYQVSGKMSWKNAGSYSLAAEVSWMCVGKTQLEYAAEALKGFRFLVEQLAKVNPSCMSANERLAFWINLYNTLIMHAYLAYGVPKSDMKLFSLMQKVSYTIGGCSFSAAEIEFVILKMKPPAYRPQIALILALHKFKNI